MARVSVDFGMIWKSNCTFDENGKLRYGNQSNKFLDNVLEFYDDDGIHEIMLEEKR
ncbi:20905_t:CDS:2 [Entrophospora sp. SA101]|nr:20905_t:CDS:2 [Entrophospora sp. SA101]